MKLCNIEINCGEKKQVLLPVTDKKSICATLICGKNKGKTLVVTAGVHGCEYIGVEAVRNIAQKLQPNDISGQAIFVPVVNTEGFYAGAKQIVPSDGVNLNRAFPGDENKTDAFQIAQAIERLLYHNADFLIDLHSGDINEMATSFVYFPIAVLPEVMEKAKKGAKAISMPYRVASTAKNGLYSWAAQKGIPSLLLEKGGMGVWSEKEVLEYENNIFELMHYLNMTPYKTMEQKQQKEITQTMYFESEEDGFWYPNIKAGQKVKKGALLGELKDMQYNLLQRYEAPYDSIVLYYTLSLGVKKNDSLIALGRL